MKKELDQFFNKYGVDLHYVTIGYTRQLVYNIKTSPTLKNFLEENNITSLLLLNEIVPYCDFKFKNYGNEKLDMRELQGILNIIIFSNKLEKFILEDHVKFSSIGEAGELFYVADDYAASYFRDRYRGSWWWTYLPG